MLINISLSLSSQQLPLTTFFVFPFSVTYQPLSFPAVPRSARYRIRQVPPSNALLGPDWRRPAYSRSAAGKSPLDNLTVQETGNASSAMNETLAGAIANDKHVAPNDLVSMRVNSESISNEIDESDLQCEKHDEQRI
jgi:hypothetical protein